MLGAQSKGASGFYVMIRTAQVGSVVLLAVLFASCGGVESAAEAPRATVVPPRAKPSATAELAATVPDVIASEIPGTAVPTPAPLVVLPPSDELISVSYEWFYKTDWSWETQIPRALYDYYRQLPRLQTTNYSVYVTHPSDDVYLDLLVDEIKTAAAEAGLTGSETVEFAAAFVQSLPYTVDSVTTPYDEYPRYPVETLVEGGGDCEDTSILLAAIVDRLGYGIVLIMLPEHVAVGIEGAADVAGTYYQYGGRDYYYLETTGEGYAVGEIPEELGSSQASILPMKPVAILTHDYQATPNGKGVAVEVTVQNLGTASAERVSVLAGFESGEWVLNGEESDYFSVAAGDAATVKLSVVLPQERHIRLLVQIFEDGALVDESNSAWLDSE